MLWLMEATSWVRRRSRLPVMRHVELQVVVEMVVSGRLLACTREMMTTKVC